MAEYTEADVKAAIAARRERLRLIHSEGDPTYGNREQELLVIIASTLLDLLENDNEALNRIHSRSNFRPGNNSGLGFPSVRHE